MREIVNFDLQLQLHQPANDVDDRRLLDLCAQWRMARAEEEVNWAEHNLANMCGSLPNKGTQL
jgi:hypothetical protein